MQLLFISLFGPFNLETATDYETQVAVNVETDSVWLAKNQWIWKAMVAKKRLSSHNIVISKAFLNRSRHIDICIGCSKRIFVTHIIACHKYRFRGGSSKGFVTPHLKPLKYKKLHRGKK